MTNWLWKRTIFFVTLWTVSHAVYISRMSPMTRLRSPVAFRPGVVLQRPAYPHPQRIVPAASRRAPYIMYRNTPHRYAMKHNISPAPTRNIFNHWKTTRLPLPSPTAEYEFVRASPTPIIHPDGTGAIHTIPAPNLSLSDKPIVVAETDGTAANDASDAPKPSYEVTEKYSDQPMYQTNAKIETPIGFSKASSMSAADLQNIVRHNAALQLASEYGFPAIQLSQPTVELPQPTIIPHQFSMQGFHGFTNQQDFMHRGAENIIIPQNAYYQQDPVFLHRLQGQLLQQYPVEFIPYTPDIQPQVQTQIPETQTPLFLLQNEQITKQVPSSFVASDNNQKNIVQRETQEGFIASIVPHAFTAKNVSENLIEIDVTTTVMPQNVTSETVSTELQAITTTIKSVDVNKEDQRTTPIYYAQIGQSVGNVIANGFYSAINDVRAASIDADNYQNENITTTTVSTTTQRDAESLLVNKENDTKLDDLKNLVGSPFEKTAESVNVAYTLFRANEKQPKINQDGEVFAGQLVEAKISEDQEFNKEKATLANRPPLRLYAVTEKRVSETTPQRTVVKAKIPPKSKLTFDDKTGEPVLRIYASYIDNPVQKEILTTKLTNMKRPKEVTRKQDNFDWKTDVVKSLEKSINSDVNQRSQFGLKLKSRSDDYIPIFEDYEE
ncbi:uncharacterized protein LOC126769200 [Nymphalis io]|uniref:uncharacterized protein LOC126769200 n=1 Tax=Inachis io TaxID=171585 RepID=UPI00216A1145|nr:uncharacterized protein LOC126769200 [Nymphalis io]